MLCAMVLAALGIYALDSARKAHLFVATHDWGKDHQLYVPGLVLLAVASVMLSAGVCWP
jgi:hypothetical protein